MHVHEAQMVGSVVFRRDWLHRAARQVIHALRTTLFPKTDTNRCLVWHTCAGPRVCPVMFGRSTLHVRPTYHAHKPSVSHWESA